jgi:hypothetical protein
MRSSKRLNYTDTAYSVSHTTYLAGNDTDLVETTPSANLTKADENASHGLEVESLVTTENEHEATESNAQSLDRFRFAYIRNQSEYHTTPSQMVRLQAHLYRRDQKERRLVCCPKLESR